MIVAGNMPCNFIHEWELDPCEKTINDLTEAELTLLIADFFDSFGEFLYLTDDATHYVALQHKLKTFVKNLALAYPNLACIDDKRKYRFLLLMAHAMKLSPNFSNPDSMDGTHDGLTITSAHVGDVSISLDNSLQSKIGNSAFKYWLTKTNYGQELLALLDYESGITLIN